MRITLQTLLFALVAAGSGLCEEKQPTPVSIETDHGGNPSDISTDELVLTLSDGTKKKLTNNGCMERVPVISHDGALVAFLRRSDTNEDYEVNWDDAVELWVMRLDNKSETRLIKSLSNPSQAAWHPKQRVLAFIGTDSDGDRALYSYDLSQKKLSILTSSADSWPEWSPCGAMIAFYDDDNRVVVFKLGDKREKVLSEDVGNGWALYWSTDGRLVFTEETKGWQIYTPNDAKPKPLAKKEHKKLKFIDQEKFGWAKNKAEQDAAPNP